MSFGLGVSPDQRAADAQIDEEMLILVTQLTNAVNWYMRERGLTRADLAVRMGVSPGRVSQILGGGENLTLRTLAALSTALDSQFDIELTALKADDAYTSRDAGHAEAARN
jgi:transcriptional regulator with XRE-family HTH domain